MRIHVLLFIPPEDPEPRRWMVLLWQHCVRRNYKPAAVVHQWCDVIKMMAAGLADRVVVAKREHAQWLEVVTEDPERDGQSDPPGARRVQRQRWATGR